MPPLPSYGQDGLGVPACLRGPPFLVAAVRREPPTERSRSPESDRRRRLVKGRTVRAGAGTGGLSVLSVVVRPL